MILIRMNVCLVVALSLMSYASAQTLGQTLPQQLQQCFEDGTCSQLVSIGQLDEAGAVSGFAYLDANVQKVLLRYEVVGTKETTTSAGQSIETFSDIFWLSAQAEYDANSAEFHELVIFNASAESVAPNPLGFFAANRLEITTDALLQGTGETSLMGLFEFPPPVAPPSLLGFPLDICLSINCSGSASLNLLGFNYQDNNRLLQFTPEPISSFANDVLFVRNRGFPGFADGPDNQAFSETLTVRLSAASVPEPNSAVVVLVGGVLLSLRRRFPS